MKKYVLILLLVLPVVVCAQVENYFTLQPDGKMLSSDGKEFVVIPFEGKTQSELYEMVYQNITKITGSERGLQTIKNESITMNANTRGIGYGKVNYGLNGSSTTRADMVYSLQFKFKDGKVRVNAPTLMVLQVWDNTKDRLVANYINLEKAASEIFKNGEVRKKQQGLFDTLNFSFTKSINFCIYGKQEEEW